MKRRRQRAGRVDEIVSSAAGEVVEEEEGEGEGANAIVSARSSGVASTALGSFS